MKAAPIQDCKAFDPSRAIFEDMIEQMSSKSASGKTLSEHEAFLDEKGRELQRQLLQDFVCENAVRNFGDSVQGSDGISRTHKKCRPSSVVTLFGKVTYERLCYSLPGHESLMPIESVWNMPAGHFSLNLQKMVAYQAARVSFDSTCDGMQRFFGVSLGKRQAEEIAAAASADFDEFYREKNYPESLTAEEQTETQVQVITVVNAAHFPSLFAGGVLRRGVHSAVFRRVNVVVDAPIAASTTTFESYPLRLDFLSLSRASRRSLAM